MLQTSIHTRALRACKSSAHMQVKASLHSCRTRLAGAMAWPPCMGATEGKNCLSSWRSELTDSAILDLGSRAFMALRCNVVTPMLDCGPCSRLSHTKRCSSLRRHVEDQWQGLSHLKFPTPSLPLCIFATSLLHCPSALRSSAFCTSLRRS